MANPNPPKPTPAQARYVRKAVALRRQLTDKNLARRFNCSPETISNYGNGRRGRSCSC